MYIHIYTLLVSMNIRIQATYYKEDTDGCAATNYHRCSYQAHTFVAVAEEEEHQHLVPCAKETPSHEALTSHDSPWNISFIICG
jgi:hypothetical protein